MTNAKAIWNGGLRFVNLSGSGHALVTDAPGTAGGGDTAPTPVELVLCGLASCSGVDVASILTKMKVPFTSLEVAAEAERADNHPRIFTRIGLKYTVRGRVPERKLQKAIDLSAKTYCSVSAMLAGKAQITHSYEILPPESVAG